MRGACSRVISDILFFDLACIIISSCRGDVSLLISCRLSCCLEQISLSGEFNMSSRIIMVSSSSRFGEERNCGKENGDIMLSAIHRASYARLFK
jgi:hypothetical protein